MTINFHDIHPAQYFSYNYLMQVDRVTLHLSDWIFLDIGLALVGLGIIAKLAAIYIKHPVTKRLVNRKFKVLTIVGLIEVMWFGFRYENAQVIGTHILAIAILVIGLLCFIPILKYYFRSYRAERDAWNKEQLKLKYLNS